MKKNILPLLVASSCLFLTSCSEISSVTNQELPHSDLLEEDLRNADLVEKNVGLKKAVDEKLYEYPETVTIHYHRDDGQYDDKCFWLWSPLKGDLVPDREFPYDNDGAFEEEDNWSKKLTFNPSELFGSKGANGFSLIIKKHGTWDDQSIEIPILYEKYTPVKGDDGKYTLDVFLTHSGTKIDVYSSKADAMSDRVDLAFLSNDLKKINIYTADGTLNDESIITDFKIFKFNEAYQGFSTSLKQTKKNEYLLFSAENVNKTNVAVKFDKPLAVNQQYVIEAHFKDKPERVSTYTVGMDNLYDTKKFNELNYNGDDLGAKIITNEDGSKKTVFKLWAPTAYKLQLKIYEKNADSTTIEAADYEKTSVITTHNTYSLYDMKLNLKDAVWECEIPEDLDGKYYTYKIWNQAGLIDNITDPYALSAGMNGKRAMVVDMDGEKVTPEGWDKVPTKWDGVEGYDIESMQDLAISEVHIRDLTMSPTWGGPKELAGTYKGFIQEGTRYHENIKTGYDHLIEYGVNAIQLLPVFDQDNSERAATIEKKLEDGSIANTYDYSKLDNFNWGYNPQNYNVVEGMYSSDPRDGHLRVKEYRELIQKFALNEGNHIRIIMDVVYNHMSSAPASMFEKLMPKYAFRLLPNGGLSNASDCGNEVKTNAPMMRKYLVDSMSMWAKEYKVKGFRFDLMGAIDMQTLNDVADALYEIDPDIVLYGEGWHASKAPAIPEADKAVEQNIWELGSDRTNSRFKGRGIVGAFNDGVRDELKGDNNVANGNYAGFIGGKGNLDIVKTGLLGGNGKKPWNKQATLDPLQNIAYVSCHDNYTLYDQLRWIVGDMGKNKPADTAVAQASVAVNGMVLMANSASFINGGEEIFRSKVIPEGEELPKTEQEESYETVMFGQRITHNSYKNSDKVNAYDYSRKEELLSYFKMYQKLVEIRRDLNHTGGLIANGKVGDGSVANIEDGHTGSNKLGLFRQGKQYNYHAYLATADNQNFTATGTRIFDNTGSTSTSGTINGTRYGFYIVQESK